MMSVERAEIYRTQNLFLPETKEGDDFGWFMVPFKGKWLRCMVAPVSNQEWQHVSVSCQKRCPTWEEMCYIKNLFWDEQDCVVQYHPPKSEYVNIAENCLHLWFNVKKNIPTPPRWMV